MNPLINTKEAARYLGVSAAFLERDRWAGARIPFIRVGTRTIRYRQKDLEAYFAANGPRSHAQIVAVAESTMLAMDRVNTWIDAMIPWSDLDAKLKLNRAPK